jgi:hypothetical protein
MVDNSKIQCQVSILKLAADWLGWLRSIAQSGRGEAVVIEALRIALIGWQ